MLVVVQHEAQVGAQTAETLLHEVVAVLAHSQFVLSVECLGSQGNVGQQGQLGELLHVLAALNLVSEQSEQIHQTHREGQSEDECTQHDYLALGRYLAFVARSIDDACLGSSAGQ